MHDGRLAVVVHVRGEAHTQLIENEREPLGSVLWSAGLELHVAGVTPETEEHRPGAVVASRQAGGELSAVPGWTPNVQIGRDHQRRRAVAFLRNRVVGRIPSQVLPLVRINRISVFTDE